LPQFSTHAVVFQICSLMGEFDLEDLPILPCACCCCCCIIIPLILICCSFQGLGATDYGLLHNSFTGVVDLENAYQGVRGFIGFWNGYLIYPGTILTLEWLDRKSSGSHTRNMKPMDARTVDGLNVQLGVVVQYRVEKDFVADIYKNYKQDYEAFFSSMLRSSVQGLISQYQSTDLYQKRTEIVDGLLEACHKVCRNKLNGYLTCWNIQLRDVIFDARIETMNVNRQIEGQKQATAQMHQKASFLRAQTTVLEAEIDKEIRLVGSRTDASAYNITRKATANAEYAMNEARAEALYIIRNTVRKGDMLMDDAQLLTFMERLAMLDAKDGPLLYGDFQKSGVYMSGSASRKMSAASASAPRGLAERSMPAALRGVAPPEDVSQQDVSSGSLESTPTEPEL